MFLKRYLTKLSEVDVEKTDLTAPDQIVDESEFIWTCPRFTQTDDRSGMIRLVIQ